MDDDIGECEGCGAFPSWTCFCLDETEEHKESDNSERAKDINSL